MAKKTKFKVIYNGKTAKFSDYDDAKFFAHAMKNSELSDGSGLLAQYRDGELTPEFAVGKEWAVYDEDDERLSAWFDTEAEALDCLESEWGYSEEIKSRLKVKRAFQ